MQVAVKNTPARRCQQDFNIFAGRRCIQKVYCGSLSWLQDPYKLWRMLQFIKKNTKFTATRMDPVACSDYHNQPSVYIFVLQKGQNLACAR